MDVAEKIVAEYLKLNDFTFVTNIKYERNYEIDILARRHNLNSSNSTRRTKKDDEVCTHLDNFHIEIQSTTNHSFNASYIEANLKDKFKKWDDDDIESFVEDTELNAKDRKSKLTLKEKKKREKDKYKHIRKEYKKTVDNTFNKNPYKKIWIHWEIKDAENPDKFKELHKEAKKNADVDNLIELKNIFTWLIHKINIDGYYFDHSQDDTARYIELFLLSQKQKRKEYFKEYVKKSKRQMTGVSFLPRLTHSEWKDLENSLGLLKPAKTECICSECLPKKKKTK